MDHSARLTKVYARDGRLVATLYELDRVSKSMQNAVIAIEDSRFRQYDGVDLRGVARAFIANLSSGSRGQGASTLTMQLARNR